MRPYARTPISALALTLCALVVTVMPGTAGVADAAKKPLTPTTTNNATAPSSTTCPDHVTPPPAVDTSEQPAPGQTVPPPMPEPATPVGGAQMAGCGVILPPGAPAAPADVNADSWVLEDLDNGTVLAAKDPHARERPASLITLLLALVVTKELDPNSTITATQDDANQPDTRVGLKPGAAYTVTNLIDALLMKSGNDVAYALATALGGLPVAEQKMDALAKQLGALDTRAATPSGLDGAGMSASAYDLAVIFRTAMTNPIIVTAVQTTSLVLPASNGQPAVTVSSENPLLIGGNSPKYLGEIGGKTGFTSDAQHTCAHAAEQNGHRIALIMLHNSGQLPTVYGNARELLDYGFQLDAAKLPSVGQVVSSNPLTTKASTTTSSTKDKTSPSASDANIVRAAQTPDDPISPFGTVGKPLTILAGVAMLLILVLVLRQKVAKKKRAARAKAAVAAKKAADAAKAAQQAATPQPTPANKPNAMGDTASWAAVDEAFAELAPQRRPLPKRVGTGTPPATRNGTNGVNGTNGTNGTRGMSPADVANASEPTEFFGRIQ